jgi:hypothetical protein
LIIRMTPRIEAAPQCASAALLLSLLICGPQRVLADRPSDLPAPVVWGTKCDRAPDGTDDNARVRMGDSGNFQSDTDGLGRLV